MSRTLGHAAAQEPDRVAPRPWSMKTRGRRGGTARLLAVTTAVAVAATAVGCGVQRSADDDPEDVSGTTRAEAPMVSCGDERGWPATVLAEGVDSSFDAQAREVFATLLADREVAVELRHFLPDGPDTEYRVLRDDGDRLTLGVGGWSDTGAGPGATVLGLEREDGAWVWTGGGDCHLQPVLAPGEAWVEVQRATPSPDDERLLRVRLSERECVSGRDPGPFLQEPSVTETEESVVVSWTADRLPRSATCQGNPSVTRTVRLEEPLGDRAVLDGSTWPPSEIRQ